MAIYITFADLTHDKQGLSNNSFPFGISLVASYAKKIFGDKIDIEIFQYPEDFSNKLEKNPPKICCFSNFSWTLDISYEYASKIKEKHPQTVIVFGGPNFPIEKEEQLNFLKKYPAIDFYIRGEGEYAFSEFLKKLEEYNYNYKEFKKSKLKTGNIIYLSENELVVGEMLPRIRDLDQIPSPYMTGILDKFFDGVLTPIVQFTRGCPFSCAYCQEGSPYFCLITRFSLERVKQEIEYLAKKIKVPNLIIADSNFGMYKEDIELCKEIAKIKEQYKWPKHIEASLGKNKDMVLDAVTILNGDVLLGAAAQSTDDDVLRAIERKNIPLLELIDITKRGESYGANSFSEIILCLPEDSMQKHIKSMLDMIDIGITIVRSHQLLMLPGSKISEKEFRNKYKMQTRFRLQPRCFGMYKVFGEEFPVAELDELCIENKTMPYVDYLKCRSFDLAIELFHNNGIFLELVNFLKKFEIKESVFINLVNKKAQNSNLKELSDEFIIENEKSLWKTEEELKRFIKQPGMIEKYIKENLRPNEQLKYRAIAFFYRMEELHRIAYDAAKELLKEKIRENSMISDYLGELFIFSLARKNNLLNLENIELKKLHYDFISLSNSNFLVDPFLVHAKGGINIKFFHSEEQKELFRKYLEQYGTNITGLGIILSRSPVNKLYRTVEKV